MMGKENAHESNIQVRVKPMRHLVGGKKLRKEVIVRGFPLVRWLYDYVNGDSS